MTPTERSFDVVVGDALRYFGRVNSSIEAIWRLRPTNEQGYVIISEPLIVEAIHDLVFGFGQVSTFLFDASARRSRENAQVHHIRMDRVSEIEKFFDGIDTSVYQSRAIRHRHMHADEWIAKLLIISPVVLVISDLALSDKNVFASEHGVTYLRVYDYYTDTLLNLDAEFDVRLLYETNLLLSERLNNRQVGS